MSTVVEMKKDAPTDDAPFQVGDIVTLKSNATPMTVALVVKQKGGTYRVKVDWMNSADDVNQAEFDARQLKLADEKDVI